LAAHLSPAISFLSVARARRIDARNVSFWQRELGKEKRMSQRGPRANCATTAASCPPDPQILNSYPDSTGYDGILFFGPGRDLTRQDSVKFSRPQ
jgi:hypothetical protein